MLSHATPLIETQPADSLPIGRYRIQLRALDSLKLTPYMGSAWRGVLGHGLKAQACLTGAASCHGCPLTRQCLYARCYEENTAQPRPYVLTLGFEQEQILRSGSTFHLDLSLFGVINRNLPQFLQALQRAGRQGIGKHQSRFELLGVHTQHQGASHEVPAPYLQTDPEIKARAYPDAKGLTLISLETPLRVKRKGQLLGPKELTFDEFLWQLKRRMQNLLTTWFDGTTLSVGLENQPGNLRTSIQPLASHLQWQDWTRYSCHQGAMQLGGITGHFVLRNTDLQAIWPILDLGQYLHVGQVVTMGLGRYSLINEDSNTIASIGR